MCRYILHSTAAIVVIISIEAVFSLLHHAPAKKEFIAFLPPWGKVYCYHPAAQLRYHACLRNLGDCMSFPQHHPVVHVPAPDSAIRQGPPTPPLAREVMQPNLTLIYAFIYLKSLLATVCHLPLHLSGAFGYDVGATARCGKGASIIANGRTGSFLVFSPFFAFV